MIPILATMPAYSRAKTRVITVLLFIKTGGVLNFFDFQVAKRLNGIIVIILFLHVCIDM